MLCETRSIMHIKSIAMNFLRDVKIYRYTRNLSDSATWTMYLRYLIVYLNKEHNYIFIIL